MPTSDSESCERLSTADRAHLFHPSTHLKNHASGATPNRIMVGGSGATVVDLEGRRSLDAFAGLYCVNVGYGRSEIADAIHAQALDLSYYHSYAGHASPPAITLAKRIVARAPSGMCRVFFGMSGSDANETQIKLIWHYNNVLGRPKKKKIISRSRAYHGSGIMTGSLTGLPVFHETFDLPRAPILHTLCPHFWKNAPPGMSEEEYASWCAVKLEELILSERPETIAAFIGEPVMGTGGIIPPPEGYWTKICALLRRYDILLVADEVITAFGRLGKWFASDLYQMEPDSITVAKGLTSGYLPLSGVILNKKMWEVLEQGSVELGPIGHGWTYSAHPLCAAAANANLDILERERIVERVPELSKYFLGELAKLSELAIVGEVRGAGLLAAIEFVADKERKLPFEAGKRVGQRVAAACLEAGMIARAMPHGDILGFAPSLTITKAEIDQIVDTARASISRVSSSLHR